MLGDKRLQHAEVIDHGAVVVCGNCFGKILVLGNRRWTHRDQGLFEM